MGLALAAFVPVTAVFGALIYLSARYGVWNPVGPTLYRMWYFILLITVADVALAVLRMGLADAVGDVARFVVNLV